ncbi:MAG: Holliday junction resolvase RuvX [Candidatus Xenobia bacterium]
MERVMGVDFGEKRTGVALSGPLGASPLCVLEGLGPRQTANRLSELAVEYTVGRIVVGLPLNMDGSAGPRAENARRFADLVQTVTALPVETQDERLTSWEAEQMPRPKRKRHVDDVAAALILEAWMKRSTP